SRSATVIASALLASVTAASAPSPLRAAATCWPEPMKLPRSRSLGPSRPGPEGGAEVGFEAPLALLAVLLAGAPVAVHLIKQRDLPTRTLPTVALLRAAQADSRQRMRLADVLLLLVRVL